MNFETSVLQVAVEDIIPNRFQPRLAFEDASLSELANSIKQHGIIQPLVLRKTGDKYEIIAGERRYKAAMMAGLTYVPAVISNIDDKTSAEVAVVENVQRRELTAIEEAKSYKALLDLGYMSQEQLAKKMGISQSAIANKLRLLNLPEEVQQAILENKISERHARSLLIIKSPEEQIKWMNKIIDERLTVRALDTLLKKEYKGGNMNNEVDIETQKANATDISVEPSYSAQPAMPMGAIDLGEKPNGRFFNSNSLEDQAVNMQMTAAINPLSQQMNTPAPAPAMPVSEAPTMPEAPAMAPAGPMPDMTPGPMPMGETTPAPAPMAPDATAMPFEAPSAGLPIAEPQTFNETVSNMTTPEVEMLDLMEPSPTGQVKDLDEAKNRIVDIVNELKNESYNVDFVEAKNGDNIILTITLKKDN